MEEASFRFEKPEMGAESIDSCIKEDVLFIMQTPAFCALHIKTDVHTTVPDPERPDYRDVINCLELCFNIHEDRLNDPLDWNAPIHLRNSLKANLYNHFNCKH